MEKPSNGNSKNVPITSPELVRHLVDPVADHAITEILCEDPSTEDLEVAVVYAQGDGDGAVAARHNLAGKAARILEILAADDVYQVDDL